MKKYFVVTESDGLKKSFFVTGNNKKIVKNLYDNVIAVLTEKEIIKIKKDKKHNLFNYINYKFSPKI